MPTLDPRLVVVRRFSPTRLITGLAAIGVGVGIFVVTLGPSHGHLDTQMLLALATGLGAAGIGLSVALRPLADVCVRCRRRLEPTGLRLEPDAVARATSALRAGDARGAAQQVGAPAAQGRWVTIWYCPECKGTVVWLGGGGRVVASGAEALVAALPGKR